MLPAFAYPALASAEGAAIDRLLLVLHGFMGLVLLGWLGAFAWALWRGRRAPGAVPPAPLDPRWLYGSAACILLVEVLLEWGVSNPIAAARARALAAVDEAVTVRVVAQQFAWNVHYPGPDGIFGATRPALCNDAGNPVGLDLGDAAAQDDIVSLNVMHLPLGRKARIELTSKDVVHSFYLPEFRVKQDIIPGMRTQVSIVPELSTEDFRALKGDPDRTYEIACAQLCGQGHASMRGFLFVDTPEAYVAWLASKAPSGDDTFWDP